MIYLPGPIETLEARAAAFAAHCHAGQVRKWVGTPYIEHPAQVAAVLHEAGIADRSMLAAAWLHDTLEDTQARPEHVRASFGSVVLALVLELTDDKDERLGSRGQRVEFNHQRLGTCSPQAQTVKLADIVANCSNIVGRAPRAKATEYLGEKWRCLQLLTRGDRTLQERAAAVLRTGFAELGEPIPE